MPRLWQWRRACSVAELVFRSRHAALAWQTPTRQPLLPTPCPGAPPVPRGCWNWSSERAPRQPLTHAGPSSVGASPHPRRRLQDQPGGRSDLPLRPPAAEGTQPGTARPPLLPPRAPRVSCSAWLGPASPARPARHLIRLRSRAEPLFRLPGLAFPGSGVGEGRRESFRHFQPPPPVPPPREGGCGRLPRLPSRELRATRGAAPGGGRRAGLAPTQRARQEAVPSPVEPPGKETGPRQDGWVWIVVLFFLFVAFLGTKKKAQPFTPLHLHLSAPEAWLHRFGETETTVYPAPHSRDGWDEHSCWNECLVSS